MKTLLTTMVSTPVEIKTVDGNFRLPVRPGSLCKVLEQSGNVYLYLEELNIIVPLHNEECAA